ncbi:MAG: disulfide bond formation protein B [Acidimicrobiales bacterium]
MSAQPPETIFALLVLGGLGALVGAVVVGGADLRREIAQLGLVLASVVAAGAMAGSLYFSEIRHFTPCELCWAQRIAMYPLAVTLPLAAWRRDRAFAVYGLVLAAIGAAISIYYQLQVWPSQASSCDAAAPVRPGGSRCSGS